MSNSGLVIVPFLLGKDNVLYPMFYKAGETRKNKAGLNLARKSFQHYEIPMQKRIHL